jgi:hypothetical protein
MEPVIISPKLRNVMKAYKVALVKRINTTYNECTKSVQLNTTYRSTDMYGRVDQKKQTNKLFAKSPTG